MHRIDSLTATSDGKFTAGNATTGTKPTQFNAEWCNSVQEELMAILSAGNVTPMKSSDNQVIEALKKVFATTVGVFQNATPTMDSDGNFLLCPVAFSLPAGKVLDLSFSCYFQGESGTFANVSVWLGTSATDKVVTLSADCTRNDGGREVLEFRLTVSALSSTARKLYLYGTFNNITEGGFFSVHGANRISY